MRRDHRQTDGERPTHDHAHADGNEHEPTGEHRHAGDHELDHAGRNDHDQHADDRDHGHGHAHGGSGVLGAIRSIFATHSHDHAASVDSALESSKKGIRAVKISLVALFATALIQVVLVAVTGSVALLADTIHNFSDALTSVPLWVALVVGRRAPTRTFTYGYRRAEDLAGLFILAMIAFSAALAAWESIRRLLAPEPVSNLGLLVAAGVVGFLGNELVALYRIRVGREIGSAALVADGYHARTDGLTSLAVVFGAAGVFLGFPQADTIMGLIITVAILWVLKGAAKQVFGRLMDAVDPALVDQIEEKAAKVPAVESVEGVRVRWIGHRLEASLHATVNCELTVAAGHSIAETVRHDLLHDVRRLGSVLVHVDPCDHAGIDHHAEASHHEVHERPRRPTTPAMAVPMGGVRRS